jgi:hypothetical protein
MARQQSRREGDTRGGECTGRALTVEALYKGAAARTSRCGLTLRFTRVNVAVDGGFLP